MGTIFDSSTSVLADFADRMVLAMRQAGGLARTFQNRVQNEGKEIEESLGDESAALLARRQAKTVIDEAVQEIILLAAADSLPLNETTVDAEESTPSLALFPQDRQALSLVIDPIDGTLEYLAGLDSYSICVGLVRRGEMILSLVYFPARDHFYAFVQGVGSRVATDAYRSGLGDAVPLVARPPAERVLYKNSRVPDNLVECLTAGGYEVVDDSKDNVGCPDAILKCVTGGAVAYLSHTRNMRDILLGAIVGAIPDGIAMDWAGNRLVWPNVGRVPRALFAGGPYVRDVLSCLSAEQQ